MSPAPREVTLEDLDRQLQDLRNRVDTLERRLAAQGSESRARATSTSPAVHVPLSASRTGSLASAAGKALLGLALAYVLRALTEMNYLPMTAGVAIGAAYALGWLFLAARAGASDQASAAIRAITSTAILIPLLWEAQIRFEVLSPWLAAGILALFSVFGLAVSWRRNVSAVAWVATLSGALTMFVLMIATRNLTPFACALLLLAAVTEASACADHWIRERWAVGFLADLSLLLMTYLATQQGGLPAGYAAVPSSLIVAFPAMLFLVYSSSMVFRTAGRGLRIRWFEIEQAAFAFALLAAATLRVGHWTAPYTIGVGAVALFCSGVCYALLLSGRLRDMRTAYAYSFFALAVTITAVALLTGGSVRVLVWCGLGTLLITTGRRSPRATLAFHGGVYIIAAAVWAGTLAMALRTFLAPVAHAHPAAPSNLANAVVVVAAAASCLMLSGLANTAARRTVALVLSAVACVGGAALASVAFLSWCPGSGATGHHCATISTALLVVLGCSTAWLSRAGRWRDLLWLSLLLVGLLTVKLLVQDFRSGSTLAFVISLLGYGVFLVALPKLIRRSSPEIQPTTD